MLTYLIFCIKSFFIFPFFFNTNTILQVILSRLIFLSSFFFFFFFSFPFSFYIFISYFYFLFSYIFIFFHFIFLFVRCLLYHDSYRHNKNENSHATRGNYLSGYVGLLPEGSWVEIPLLYFTIIYFKINIIIKN